MAGRWRLVPHTADVAVAVTGRDLEEVLRTAALALWSLSWDVRRVRPQQRYEVAAEGRDAETLLVNFLNELIFRHEADRVVWRDLESLAVEERADGGLQVRAVAVGELLRPGHALRREIKAATLHGLRIERRGGKLAAQVIFDL